MARIVNPRTSLVVLITFLAMAFCFQLGTQSGRTGDEAAAAQLEQKMAQMDQQMRQEFGDQATASADHAPVMP